MLIVSLACIYKKEIYIYGHRSALRIRGRLAAILQHHVNFGGSWDALSLSPCCCDCCFYHFNPTTGTKSSEFYERISCLSSERFLFHYLEAPKITTRYARTRLTRM
jgi:hypothetical protein